MDIWQTQREHIWNSKEPELTIFQPLNQLTNNQRQFEEHLYSKMKINTLEPAYLQYNHTEVENHHSFQ